MGPRLIGYVELRLLRASSNATVYTAIRELDGRPVIAKVFELERDQDEIQARAEHEFELLQSLQIEGVVRPLDLQRVGEQLVLLLERAPGVDLATHTRGQAIAIERFADIAVQLAQILARVHALRVIHRDIKPANILVDPDDGAVHLADFGISVLLERERRHVYDPEIIEGTLPYLSPEQTGRVKRPVDFRSDLYSLGVTFFELLTGCRPFTHAEPLELIHAHLARSPVPPQDLRPDLPDGFARVVTKLLAKAPEYRYQTAAGLAADLSALRERLARGDLGQDFVLGLEDHASELQLTHELHGRERERAALLDELELVIRRAQPRLFVLAGPAGVGKSALIRDFEGEVARVGSYVAHGRFARGQARPYSAFVEAFAGLTEQLLTESEARLARWRARLEAALGGVAGVIVELVPALALVLGGTDPPTALDPRAARNRVQIAVARFLSVFCEDQRPLILALEDLQWADESSVALLSSLFEGAQSSLFVLASLREVSLEPEHCVRGALARLPDTQIVIERLEPLSREAVEALLADTLGRSRAEVEELVRLVGRKTANNPLFIRQLLEHLVATGLLTASGRGWTWDTRALERASVPDDVLGVMEAKLAGLRPELAELIQRAACIGDRFDLPSLELVAERPKAEVVAAVYELVELGLVDRSLDEYRFAHHSVREAACARAGPALTSQLRWRLGQGLLAAGSIETSARLFELLEHLDAGLDDARASLGEDGRVELVRLYARAGHKALASAALEAALRYLDRGLALLGDALARAARAGPAAPHHDLFVELHYARAQVMALRGERDAAAEAFTELLDWPLGDRDRGRIAASWITQLYVTGDSAAAVAYGLELLAELGCRVPARPTSARMRLVFARARAQVRELDAASLRALPACEDARASAVMDVIGSTKSATYVRDRRLYVVLIATCVRWFLRYGVHPSAPLALAQFATSLGGFFEVEEALRVSELSGVLSERFAEGPSTIRAACATQLFVAHLGRPFARPLERIRELYPRALEIGDLLWASYAGAVGLTMHIEVGTHLTVLQRISRTLERDLGARASSEAQVIAASLGALATLLGGPSTRGDELELSASRAWAVLDPEAVAARGGSRYSVFVASANLAFVKLLIGEVSDALGLCLAIFDEVEEVFFASWMSPRVALMLDLAAEELARTGRGCPPKTAAARRRARKILARWARGSKDNYGHYLELVDGLRARGSSAHASLERARASAARRGCRWVEGLAAEQLGHLAEREGLPGFAEGARRQAYAAYEAWGAKAKLEQLVALHDELGDTRLHAAPPTLTGVSSGSWGHDSTTPSGSGSALDFAGVLRSVTAIAAELSLDEVIANVLEATLTLAGADHGVLVLERGGVLGVVAEAELDLRPEVLATPRALREASACAPSSLIHFVLRTQQALVIGEVAEDSRFHDDPYLVAAGVRSLLGMPITLAQRTLGVLVLENRLSPDCFTAERFEALQMIAGQAARALDRARIHGALRESEARWRSLVDGVPDLIALIGADGETEFVNRSADPQAKGPDHARILQRFAEADSAPSWRETVDAVLAGGAMRELELELCGEQPGAPSSWYIARVAAIELDEEPSASASRVAIVIATDVSARKRAEAEAARLETQLRQQQRLESIGTLASGVAHEINNPIQGIMNYAELIGTNLDDHALISEFSDEIRIESERVATIVRSLLAFSRREQHQPLEDADVGELIGGTIALAHAVMRRDQVEVSVAIPAGLPPVRCRTQQIQQIIMNLITNARDALNSAEPRPGASKRIEVRAELVSTSSEGREQADRLRVTVEDWGSGIPPEVLPHIFDPFFTTKGRDKGTGLGLAVSHGIALEHDGDLIVDSRLGEGTRFHLELPIWR